MNSFLSLGILKFSLMKVIIPKRLQVLPINKQTKATFYLPETKLLQIYHSMLRTKQTSKLHIEHPSKLRFNHPSVRIISSFGALCKASFDALSNPSSGISYLPSAPHTFLANKLLPCRELHNFPTQQAK